MARDLILPYKMEEWGFSLLLLAVLLVTGELGFRAGRKAAPQMDTTLRSALGMSQTAVAALLGLLLAFTFGAASQRYADRKQVVFTEVNALRTSFLRAQLLPEPRRREMERLLQRYVEMRIAYYSADVAQIEALNRQVKQMQ